MNVLWTPEAVQDLERLKSFIESYGPSTAQRAVARILQAAAALAGQPELGRVVEDARDLRDMVAYFGGGSYFLRYRIYPDAVVIARVWHSREDRH